MGKINFDNIMKVMNVLLTFTGVTLVSVEIDFDIPRGFIVKIHRAILEHKRIGEDIEGLSADTLYRLQSTLIKDPDDSTSIGFVSNRVDHDILMQNDTDVAIIANAADTSVAIYVSETKQDFNFSAEGLDVFTARNMRLNIDAIGTDAASVTEGIATATIHYTLEKITDDLIIDLLDIL